MVLTTKAGIIHQYTVEEMRVVNPYEEWVTEESDTEVLTLFTCAEHGTRRFACRCVLVKDYGSERGCGQRITVTRKQYEKNF